MNAPTWMTLTTENDKVVLVITRNLSLWKYIWKTATGTYKFSWYRYPQVFLAVTKCWWNFV